MNSVVPIPPTKDLVTAVLRLVNAQEWTKQYNAFGWEVLEMSKSKDILVVMHKADSVRGQAELMLCQEALREHFRVVESSGTLYVYLRTEGPTESRWKVEVMRAKLEIAEGLRVDQARVLVQLEERLKNQHEVLDRIYRSTDVYRQVQELTGKIPDLTAEIDRLKGALRKISPYTVYPTDHPNYQFEQIAKIIREVFK